MTTEEKAKAWDEAIERAKSKIRNDKDHVLYEEDILDIFPSLKESDEEIRKEIVNFINHKKAMGSVTPEESKRTGSWIAWLEKKCNQKPAVIIPKFRVGDVIRLKGSTAEYTIESISGECYHGKGWGLHIGCEEDYELVEQKPAWSEEDEQMYIEIIYILAGFRGNEVKLDWLKSIKDRVQPQNTWKPSESDIRILEQVIDGTANPINYHATLHAILEKLKKLREK